MAVAGLTLFLLGGFEARLNEIPLSGIKTDKARALLTYLAMEKARPHRRQALAGLLWPAYLERSARANLRNVLTNLRQVLLDEGAEHPFLLIEGETIQLNPQADVWVDVWEFDRSLRESPLTTGDQRTANTNPQSKINNLKSAISLYRSSFLEGFTLPDSPEFDTWLLIEREALHRQAVSVLYQLAEAYEKQGELENACAYAQRQLELEPWLEEAHRQLMRLLAQRSQRAAALAQYEACRKALADELQVEPSTETKRLYEAIRGGDIQGIGERGEGTALAPYPLTPAVLPPEPGASPFKGLQYFDVADAALFFGREALTARLVGHIREMVDVGIGAGLPNLHRSLDGREDLPLQFLAVVGASGSGKSSVVRAGMVPALQSGEILADDTLPPEGSPSWHIHVFTPMAHPVEALAVSLTREAKSVNDTTLLMDDLGRDARNLHMYAQRLLAPQSPGLAGKCRLLLVVDQFEELFTLCRSETERTAFLDNLLTAVQGGGPTQVVVVLRADFYGHCAQYPRLRQALCARQEYIGPMDAGELRRAIEEPAQLNGWEFEPGLVELILRDIGGSEDHPPEPGALPLLEHALLETWQRRSGRTLTLKGYAEAGGVHGAIAKTAESVFTRLTIEEQALAKRIFLRLTELGEGTQDTRRRVSLDELVPASEDAHVVVSLLKTLADARLITLAEGTAEVAHEALIREWPALRQWLNEDREGLRLHRHLTDSAEAWTELERDAGELYRGARLAQAQEWAEGHAGDLNTLEREYLQASQAQAEREAVEREARMQRELEAAKQVAASSRKLARTQRQRSLLLAAGLLIAIVLGLLTFIFYRQSNQNLDTARAANTQVVAVAATAQANEKIAIGRQALAQAQLLTFDSSTSMIQKGLLAVEGLQRAPGLEAFGAAQQVAGIFGHRIARMAHDWSVTALAFSPDGKRLVTVSADGIVRVWDVSTWQEKARRAHGGYVTAVAFSPDGGRVVSGSGDGTVRVWNAATGEEVACMKHDWSVTAVAFSPDGRRVVSGSYDHTACVWDVATNEKIFCQTHEDAVSAVAFSPNGSKVISGSYDQTVRVWDASSGYVYRSVKHEEAVTAVAFPPLGNYFASGSKDGAVRVWDIFTGEVVASIQHDGSVTSVAFSPSGRGLVSGSADGMVQVLDMVSEKVVRMRHEGRVNAVAYSPDGQWVVSGSADGTARVWKAASGEEIARALHDRDVTAVAFNPRKNWIATGGGDGTVQVWEVTRGTDITSLLHTNRVNAVAYSPDGQWVVSGSADGTARVWKAASGEEITRTLHYHGVTAVAFSPDGERVVSGGVDGTARVWWAATGVEITRTLYDHGVTAVAFSPDGRLVVSGSNDKTVRVWDATSGDVVADFSHEGYVKSVAFSPDGEWVVSGSADGMARVWNVAKREEVAHVLHDGAVTAVAFSPDGQWVVSGSADGMARVWNVVTREKAARVEHVGGVNDVAFSPDGRWVVSASEDGRAIVWDPFTAKEVAHVQHERGVNAVAFSPDGHWVVSVSEDGMARVWEAATRIEVARKPHDGALTAVAFSPDGRWIASGGDDNTVHVWVWQPQDVAALLCDRLPRNFTQEEWRQFFGDVEYSQTCANLPEGK